MPKEDGPQQETNLNQAGLPPSYGYGIQQGMYNNRYPQMMNGFIYGGGLNGTGPNMSLLSRYVQGNNPFANGYNSPGNIFRQVMNQPQIGPNDPYMQMQRPNWQRAGFNFGTPIASPNLFQGLMGNGGQQTTPLGTSLGWRDR